MESRKLEGIIEAILFAMGDSVPLVKIADAIGQDTLTTRKLIYDLMDRYKTEEHEGQ